jgi:GT2 family glycosyltransferase
VRLSLSLVICTFRRPAAVRRLLEALRSQACLPDEVLVVDASPDIETEAVVSDARLAGLIYHRVPPEERGLTRQRNWGIDRANGDVIAFLDDDTVPEPDYFAEVLACFERHPGAVGVGGYIANEVNWKRASSGAAGLGVFRSHGWERREDYRWRLRRLLRLEGAFPAGWMPPSGHARGTGFVPPDGEDHRVEFFMGGASGWTRALLERVRFSSWFEGYGLYEDLDFCLRASGEGSLWLCTRARLTHLHDERGRPNRFRYGEMVVRNGWRVWRLRWPTPDLPNRARWWVITLLLALCRLGDALRSGTSQRRAAWSDVLGRLWGMARTAAGRARREPWP